MYIQSTIISNDSLQKEMRSLLDGETNWIANCSNFSSLLFYALKDINCGGFYILDGDELVLGPFQGKPACIRIPMQKGVCGTQRMVATKQHHRKELYRQEQLE